MNMKPQKPIKQPQQQINIEDTESLVCDECGNGFVSKKPRRTGQNNFCSKKCGNKFRVNKHRNRQ